MRGKRRIVFLRSPLFLPSFGLDIPQIPLLNAPDVSGQVLRWPAALSADSRPTDPGRSQHLGTLGKRLEFSSLSIFAGVWGWGGQSE